MPACLVSYTPGLKATEGRWKMVRKATANRLYGTTETMKDSIWPILGSG